MKKLFSITFISLSLITLLSCKYKEEDISISTTRYKLYPNEYATIHGTGDLNKVEWYSEDEFVASISGLTIHADKIGTTLIRGNAPLGPLGIQVVVSPKHDLYKEPSVDFGTTIETIKSKYGNPYMSTSNSLLYNTNNSLAPYIMYMFGENKLTYSVVVLKNPNNDTYIEEIADFLTERYTILEVTNSMTIFIHFKGKKSAPEIEKLVILEYYNSSTESPIVIYAPYSKNKTMSSPAEGNEYPINIDNYLKQFSLK